MSNDKDNLKFVETLGIVPFFVENIGIKFEKALEGLNKFLAVKKAALSTTVVPNESTKKKNV